MVTHIRHARRTGADEDPPCNWRRYDDRSSDPRSSQWAVQNRAPSFDPHPVGVLQQPVQRLGLRDSSWEAIEEKAAPTIQAARAFANEIEHGRIRAPNRPASCSRGRPPIAGPRSSSGRHFEARKMSPVDNWQTPMPAHRSSAWVPLPTPGAPSRTSRAGCARGFGGMLHSALPPLIQIARSFFSFMPILQLRANLRPLSAASGKRRAASSGNRANAKKRDVFAKNGQSSGVRRILPERRRPCTEGNGGNEG